MRILILGGTVFLGRALTDAALAAGHVVSHLNRCQSSGPDPRVECLRADRTDESALRSAVAGKRWDVVVDTSGYLPGVVSMAVKALRSTAPRYAFVSTISVYSGQDGFGEDASVAPPPDPVPDAMTPETYGALKAMCEAAVRDVHGEHALIVRPGLIVGPHDPTDRFTYWPHRIALGGTVLAPGRSGRRIQFIDVRDLATWMVSLLARDIGGTFNATGPAGTLTMGNLLESCITATRSAATLAWASEAFLQENGVTPWKEMPLWVPEKDGGFLQVPIGRALGTALRFRPLAETITDTLAWSRKRPVDHTWKAGLAPERETALLKELGQRALSADKRG